MSSFTQPRVAQECAGRTCARIKIQRLNLRSWLRASFFCIALQYQNECGIEQNVWKTNKVKDIANVGLSFETAKVVLTNCSCQQLIISFKLSNVANLRIIYIYMELLYRDNWSSPTSQRPRPKLGSWSWFPFCIIPVQTNCFHALQLKVLEGENYLFTSLLKGLKLES